MQEICEKTRLTPSHQSPSPFRGVRHGRIKLREKNISSKKVNAFFRASERHSSGLTYRQHSLYVTDYLR